MNSQLKETVIPLEVYITVSGGVVNACYSNFSGVKITVDRSEKPRLARGSKCGLTIEDCSGDWTCSPQHAVIANERAQLLHGLRVQWLISQLRVTRIPIVSLLDDPCRRLGDLPAQPTELGDCAIDKGLFALRLLPAQLKLALKLLENRGSQPLA